MSLPCSSPMLVPLPRAALEHQQALAEPSLCLGGLDRHCHPPEAFSLLQTPCFIHGSLQPLSCHHHQGSTTITNTSLPMDGHRALDSRDGAGQIPVLGKSPHACECFSKSTHCKPSQCIPCPSQGCHGREPLHCCSGARGRAFAGPRACVAPCPQPWQCVEPCHVPSVVRGPTAAGGAGSRSWQPSHAGGTAAVCRGGSKELLSKQTFNNSWSLNCNRNNDK